MEPGQLIFSLLSQAPDVAALLDSRIYPVRAPQGKPRPYVTYQLISDSPEGGEDCDMDDEARVQVSIFTDTYAEVCALAKAIRKRLHRYDGQGACLTMTNQLDQDDPQAVCFFRSQDYLVEFDADASVAVLPPTPNEHVGFPYLYDFLYR